MEQAGSVTWFQGVLQSEPRPGTVTGPRGCNVHPVRSEAGAHCAIKNGRTKAQAARFADVCPVGLEERVRGTRPQRISPDGNGMVQMRTLNISPFLSDRAKAARSCGMSSRSLRLTTSTGECM